MRKYTAVLHVWTSFNLFLSLSSCDRYLQPARHVVRGRVKEVMNLVNGVGRNGRHSFLVSSLWTYLLLLKNNYHTMIKDSRVTGWDLNEKNKNVRAWVVLLLLFADFVVFLSYVSLPLQTSSLVASEILRRQSPSARATVIEKWATVGEVCRNLHNFNSVLEISSAFMSSSIFRLKKTWEKVSKQVSTAYVQSTTVLRYSVS